MGAPDSAVVLNARQLKFLDWLCTPPVERVPPSQTKYAIEENVDETTLRRWKKDATFKAEWDARLKHLQGDPARVNELLDALYESGTGPRCTECKRRNPDVKAAELWAKLTGLLKPEALTLNKSVSLGEISDAELDELVASQAAIELERRAQSKPI